MSHIEYHQDNVHRKEFQ